ncbi:MAG: response regulator [Bacteroidota bacterium]
MSVRTLIVDDDKAVRFFHRITVTESALSPEPLSFCDGQEAMDYMDKNFKDGENYLVLLDINMPVMNGWEMLKAISEKPYSAHVFFAMVTSSVDKADRDKAKAFTQVIDFVEKPISAEECKRLKESPPIAGLINLDEDSQ